ncbi:MULTISPECIES: hypothetical protein [Rhizobium]|uniref:hypothetical protein n=1 Tax=Rhizobium TaxID=379 RepID=UPI001AEE2BC5|nr:hypothetical protein [Rhizobium paranaense]
MGTSFQCRSRVTRDRVAPSPAKSTNYSQPAGIDRRLLSILIIAHYAQEFLADLTAKIAWIAEVDFTGSPRDHISEGLRGLLYRNHCIYYRCWREQGGGRS